MDKRGVGEVEFDLDGEERKGTNWFLLRPIFGSQKAEEASQQFRLRGRNRVIRSLWIMNADPGT